MRTCCRPSIANTRSRASRPSISSGRNEPIAPHLDELLRPTGDELTALGVSAFREGHHADAVVIYEAVLELMADQPAQRPAEAPYPHESCGGLARAGIGQTGRKGTRGSADCKKKKSWLLILWRTAEPAINSLSASGAWATGPQPKKSAKESLAAYDGAPKAEPVDPDMRRQSEDLLAALKAGKAPPPLAAIDGQAAIEAARDRYRAREALTKIGLKQPAAPLLDQLLGPAKPTKEVFDALDRQYREQGKPAIWFLPLNEPISPHLDELLGKPSK